MGALPICALPNICDLPLHDSNHPVSNVIYPDNRRSLSSGNNKEKMAKVEQITQPYLLAEGPHWDSKEQVLYFVDIYGNSVHIYDPKKKTDTAVKLEDTVGVVIPVKNNPDKFILGYGRSITVLDWDRSSKNYKLHHKFQVENDKPENRFNDGKADANGNIWLGTMGTEVNGTFPEGVGTLYRVKTNGELDAPLESVTISNGLAWNSENTIMYYIDSTTRKIDAFDYDLNTASIENRRTFFDFAKENVLGVPDGMTIDADDNLWIACYGASQVIQVSKEGKLLRSIKFPVTRITSAGWGGPNLDILYVTSARIGLPEEQLKSEPAAGAVFSVTGLGVKGRENYLASESLVA